MMMKRILQLKWLILMIGVAAISGGSSSSFTAFAQKPVKDAPNRNELVRKYVYPLLRDPIFARLNWQDSFTLRTDQYGRTNLPDEMWDHEEGIFRIHEVQAVVWSTAPLRYGVYSESLVRVIRPGLDFLSEQVAQEQSLQLLRVAFPHFFAQGPLPVPKRTPPGPDGNWRFQWQRYRADELPDTNLHAHVRAIDGRITSFGAGKFVGEWPHKIKPAQAKKAALEAATGKPYLKDVEILGWDVGPGGYYVSIQARERSSGAILQNGAFVDAMTGEASLNNRHGWQSSRDSNASRFIVEDELPVWTQQGLMFISKRSLAGMPTWAVFPAQVLLKNKTGQVAFLTKDMKESPPSFASGLPNGSWTAIEVRKWTYAFNLESGEYRVLGHPAKPSSAPTVNKDGSWAIIRETARTGNSDLDLMADNLERSSQLGSRGRLVMPRGHKFLSLFSPDSQWVYFVTANQIKSDYNFRLRRLAAKDALTQELKYVQPAQLQTITKLSEEVERISFFPDGKRVLLQNRKGMFVVSVPEGGIMQIVPKEPQDAEVGAPITETRDGWAGPGNDCVTFSGKTTDKAGKIRWRIYSVNLKGGDLQAHTSHQNEPVPMYKFPGSNKTAYDLAKEWALNETMWEDEQKHRNH